MYISWFAMLIISIYTAQSTVHLEFNFILLILEKISPEAITSAASIVVTALKACI